MKPSDRESDMGDLAVTSKVAQKVPKRNILITSALPCVNNVPHLGNIIGCVLSADVFARYCRLRGHNTVYICGTDEYGTATETKAMEEKCSPQEICDKYHAIHREVYEWFNISFEKFGRTSKLQQMELCQAIFKKLLENDWISENTMKQLYCDTSKRFLADRLVEGTCPTQGCDCTSGRGDQFEHCRKLLNPTELKDPKCKVMFPSMLLGTGQDWTLMKTISVTEYLNYEAGKFLKSKDIRVFGNDAIDTNIPVEVWRYYLLTTRPEVSDTLFTWADLQQKLKSELLDNLGRFINKVLNFVASPSGKGYGSIIPDVPHADSDTLTEKLAENVGEYVEQYIEAMEKVKLEQGLKTAMRISRDGNAYLEESRLRMLYKQDRAHCSIVIRTSVGLVHLLACLLEPFMPSFSCKVFKQLNLPPEMHISLSYDKGDIDWAKRPWDIVPIGHKIGKPEQLFKELKKEVKSLAVKVTKKLQKTKVSGGTRKKRRQSKKSAADAEISISRLDIRVGLITQSEKHPFADSLSVEEIDVGEGQPRIVVSELVKYIPLEEMQNRKVCVLCNLNPVIMRGIKSQAIVLTATKSDHTAVELVDPPKSARVGERVTCPGFKGEPDDVLKLKKKVWETLQVDLHTNTERVVCYKDIPLTTSAGVCTVSSICGGQSGVSVEDIIRKVAMYFEIDQGMHSNSTSLQEKIFIFLRKLYDCELWLVKEFCVKEFGSLGYGEFLIFLEKYACLLPHELCKFLTGDASEKCPLEVCMLQHHLVVVVSQALNSLWEDENITKQNILLLLRKQFPSVSFKTIENGSVEDFLSIVGKHKNTVISKCVLFSMTLCGTSYAIDSSAHYENAILKSTLVNTNSGQKAKSHDAIQVLHRAPMMSDLNLWLHWDLLFAPSLGPLIPWLLNEVKTDELLCLVTKDGKVIRLDHLATIDSFLEAALQGSSFQTALKMLSLFSLVGGEKHVPVSLLKIHTQHAFEVILKNYLDDIEVYENKNSLNNGKAQSGQEMVGEVGTDNFSNELHRDLSKMNIATSVISRFVLECLGYLPAEFRGFATDVLLSGMQSVVKYAASAILSECSQSEQRLMLHEVGLSLGIVEWINDYYAFCGNDTINLVISGDSCSNAVRYEKGSVSKHIQDVSDKFSASEGSMGASVRADEQKGGCSDVCLKIGSAEVSDARIGSGYTQDSTELNECEDAAQVIEAIRRDEFGLDSSLSSVESIMLKKQHARLGRALHCLSQELYSQDSHFLLELVQNADDNTYPTNVEPTLTFILQESGIIVLNNERGFSAQNIKALCDVGSSTKKGSNAGYIGQKGIGFKSVFRVTEAPEIHSNGFHIKFDISQGQIGFVLPTVVPPCDVDLFNRLTSSDSDQPDRNCWNTCIVLPFRSKLSDATVMKNIINMFSDLHPSLLLFLHRLQCIKLRNLLDDSLTVMRKEIVGDGIVKVSHGNKKMTWFVVSQKLQADFIRCDVQKTEISIAFTLKESDNGDYSPNLVQQPVFAFLPLRSYGLKFILQGDFVLPSSREEVDGDSPWNQWLLSEFPNLFVNVEKSFCSLPCFRENPGRAVEAYMSFVPLVGEVHGFFSSLPRLIISKLRMSNCLLLEGGNNEWVPPCKVLRGWNEQARLLLPDGLLHVHLGLGFLDKNIVLPDPLARALGIAEYGPKVLLQVMDSLCHVQNGLKSMGLGWLASWLSALYAMSFNSFVGASFDFGIEMEFIENLRKLALIPLSDGTYGAVDEGPIWLHLDALSTRFKGQHGLESFPNLHSKLRIVSPALFSMSSVDMSSKDAATVDKLTSMLGRIGVQQLSAHEIVKVHILPAITDNKITDRDKNLMTEYVCFVMVHLQSSCSDCHVEREHIISEIQNKAYISTNHGFKRPSEVLIHFSKEFGNPVDINKLISMVDMKWHEVDISYLKHPVTKLLPCGLMKWREFFQQIGITDFVKVNQVEKGITDMSDGLFKNVIWDKDLISLGSNVTDWESPELVDLLFLLARDENKSGCKYLLEVLDTLWDDCYSEKATGYCTSKSVADRKPFKSSFISNICDVKWVASTMDDALHYPKDLYHDSDAVRSILGASAPFAVPKVRSGNFVSDIGFKTIVSLDDAVEVLKLWRRENPFKASLAQMFKFYTLIWNEMTASKQKIADDFNSGPSIFVPYASRFRHEDVVSGTFLSPEEVYWHDSVSFVDQIKEIHPQCSSTGTTHDPLNKTLCNFYPGLHDFFVDGCGVHETPPLRSYLQILLHLSNVALPSQAANAVFQVFLKWADGLKSGLSAEDIVYLKDSLTKMQFMVLPTVQDKWVSLHPSFGLLCWCDDETLSKQFKHLDGIDFLYFGELSKDDKEMLRTKVSILMQTLGIPALSEIVTREAIYYGLEDSSFKAALLDWALPYAQRYLHSVRPDKYSQLKQSGSDILNRLQVVVVEKLFYRNTIRSAGSESQKQVECSCLLEGSILYMTQESDSHALFMELSRLFFNGNPELHLANFLHMITTMAESGSTEEQTEFFILNSQKVSKLPDGESVWSLSSVHSMTQNDKSLQTSFASTEGIVIQTGNLTPISVDNNWTIEDDSAASAALVSPDSTHLLENFGRDCNETDFAKHIELDPINLGLVSDPPDLGSSTFSKRDQLRFGTPNEAQAIPTERQGEQVAFKYFIEKAGKSVVKWVNEHRETGLPYDIVVEEDNSKQFIEVKATKSSKKDWFVISMRELQFAIEKGEAFSIAHVILLPNNVARVSVYNNLAKLCQLRLAVLLPENQKEFAVVS